MKRTFILLAFTLTIIGCSSNDDSAPEDNNVSTTDYLPLTTSNYWTYDVESEFESGSDSLYIPGDTVIAGNTYKKFKTDELPYGFFSNSLSNNGVRKQGDRLLLTGTAELPFSEDFPLSIALENFTILKENAANGDILSTKSGVIQQPYDGYTINFIYTLTAMAKADIASYTAPNGEIYANVKPVEMKLNLKVTADLFAEQNTITAIIMQPQDVVISTQYFAELTGVVHTVTDLNYQLSDLSMFNVTLPIPQTGSEHKVEVLTGYVAE